MKKAKPIRDRWLNIRLNETEEKQLDELYKKSTARALSEYARTVLLQEPISIIYRNRSMDEFLAVMSQLITELNHIGNNFNQQVKKLHSLYHLPEIQPWLMLNEASKKSFFQQVDSIRGEINKIYQQWSQE